MKRSNDERLRDRELECMTFGHPWARKALSDRLSIGLSSFEVMGLSSFEVMVIRSRGRAFRCERCGESKVRWGPWTLEAWARSMPQ